MVTKPDFTADNAMFNPNNTKVTAYSEIMAPLRTFSDTFFSIIL